jgi:cyclic-di-GMP phosphodiesterase TipF (flagellum assembly factor)
MSRFWHLLLFFVYVTLAAATGVLAHRVLPGVTPVTSALIGVVFFLGCAVLQESLIRRAESVRALRRLLLLKRALDRNREELALARDEIRRLYDSTLEGGPPRAPEPPPEPERRADDEAEARELLERLTADARAETDRDAPPPDRKREPESAASRLFGRGRSGGRSAGRAERPMPGRDANADRSLKEANAEVRVLHSLVEQLYAGRGKSPPSLSEDAVSLRSEPSLGAGSGGARAAAGGGRAALRVVGSAAPNPEEDEPEMIATVRDALRDDRIDLYLQPIVSLPQRKRRFYECFSRVRTPDGEVIGPDQYIETARESGLLTAIDNMLLFRCVQLLRKLRRKDFSAAFFCNIAPHTLSDREFFRDFIEYMESHAELAPNLVLEFAQGDAGVDLSGLGADLDRLAALGYRFSLDGVTVLDMDLDLLEARGFRYVKVDSRTILRGLQKGGSAEAAVRTLKQELDHRGIDLIIDRIETEGTLVELLDFSIDYGQGYLFGEPRLSKDPSAS